MRSRLVTAVLLVSTVLVVAPAADAADGWRWMVRDHGGRLEGCLVSAPGERTAGWVVKVRGNNENGRHGHRFGVSVLKNGPGGNDTAAWRGSVDKGQVSRAVKVTLPRAADWLGVGMEDFDGTGGLGSVYDPAALRRC